MPKFRVAICGGGLGGLTLALALAPYKDIEIDIYEGAARFEEIGAGVLVWGRGLTVLKKMGLEERIRALSGASPGKKTNSLSLRRADRPAGGEEFGELVLSTFFGLHRATFLDLVVRLLAETGRASTHFGKRCVSFTQPADNEGKSGLAENAVTLNFADGTSASCDVLIGCDGIKSVVRGELMQQASKGEAAGENLGRYARTKFSGTAAYRALVKPEDLRAINPNHSALTVQFAYCGKDRHITSYPVGERFINIVAYSSDPSKQEEWAKGPWVVEVDREEMLEQYRNFEPDVQAILKCINKSSRWAMYSVEPLPFWSKGRVTLLGDAAHAMPPFIGAGGGQGFEDAYVLGQLLGSPIATRDTLPSVLLAYEQVRKPIANAALLSTREARRAFEFLDEYADRTNEQIVEGLNNLSNWLWEGKGDPDDLVREAEKLVQEWVGGKHDV